MDRSTSKRGYFGRARVACLGFALLWGVLAALMHVLGAPTAGLVWPIAGLAAVTAGFGLLAPARWCSFLLFWNIFSQDMDER